MKKIKVVEMILYAALLILSILMLLISHPHEDEIVLPRDFQIEWQGGDGNDVISDK